MHAIGKSIHSKVGIAVGVFSLVACVVLTAFTHLYIFLFLFAIGALELYLSEFYFPKRNAKNLAWEEAHQVSSLELLNSIQKDLDSITPNEPNFEQHVVLFTSLFQKMSHICDDSQERIEKIKKDIFDFEEKQRNYKMSISAIGLTCFAYISIAAALFSIMYAMQMHPEAAIALEALVGM